MEGSVLTNGGAWNAQSQEPPVDRTLKFHEDAGQGGGFVSVPRDDPTISASRSVRVGRLRQPLHLTVSAASTSASSTADHHTADPTSSALHRNRSQPFGEHNCLRWYSGMVASPPETDRLCSVCAVSPLWRRARSPGVTCRRTSRFRRHREALHLMMGQPRHSLHLSSHKRCWNFVL
jgi:hypothetical protein